MQTRDQLRLNAYSVTAEGHILCNREGRSDERTAVLRIALAEDSEAGRDIVERLVAMVDEPRALLGRAKNGSAVLLFRCGECDPVPHNIRGSDSRTGVFELATRDGVRFTIACRSDGETLDVSAYTWMKGRGPLEIERDRLPVLTGKIGEAVVEAAFEFATWALLVERDRADAARLAQRMADIASGKIRIPTDAEREAAEDEQLAAGWHPDLTMDDGVFAQNVIAARRRVARRKAAAEAARLASMTPEERAEEIQAREDAATVERHQGRKISESDGPHSAEVIRARARHAARQKAQATGA